MRTLIAIISEINWRILGRSARQTLDVFGAIFILAYASQRIEWYLSVLFSFLVFGVLFCIYRINVFRASRKIIEVRVSQ